MTAGMAGVIAAHPERKYGVLARGGWWIGCTGCDWHRPIGDSPIDTNTAPLHADHVAEELAKAGYGDVREAKVEAVRETAMDWAAYQSARMPRSDVLQVPVWLNQRAATMESPHGVD